MRLCHTQRIDDAVVAATQVIGHLYTANERATDAGRRADDDGLDYRSFYNDAVNLEVNLKEDYRRWRSSRGEFSFCEHPFVLDPASKSRVLMYDATAQMTHEFEGAILRSLFVGATSPYLVVKVRRSHLIHDTLLQMGMRKDDLKKPLKVQFVGEDGIDEGAIDTEWVAGVDCAADALSKAVGRKLFLKFKPFLMGSAEREMALAMVGAQALDRQNKVVALAATSVDEELRTIAAGVVAMANSR